MKNGSAGRRPSSVTPPARKLLILFLVALGFVTAILIAILVTSRKLDVYYDLLSENFSEMQVIIEDDGLMEMEFLKVEDGIAHIRLKPAGTGRTGTTTLNLLCQYADYDSSARFGSGASVSYFGIMYDSAYGFNGIHACFILIGLFFLTISVLLFLWHREYRKASFFSYRSILDFGLCIYFLMQGLIYFGAVVLSHLRPLPLRGDQMFTLSGLALTIITLASFPILFLFSLMITTSNIVLIHREGKRPSNALGILLSIFLMVGLVLIAFLAIQSPSLFSLDLRDSAMTVARGAVSSIFFYFVCNMFSTLIFCQLAGRHRPAYDKDFVIILGCGIREDGTLYPLLQGRADRAITFAREQQAATGRFPILVPSGGQGPDECMPEGEAIRNYLLTQGIPEDHILPETRSVNTLQNMRFSREVILESMKSSSDEGATEKEDSSSDGAFPANVAFSTTNFHVFRSGILASDAGLNADGMGAKTKWYFWPNALIREFIGLLVRNWKLHLVLLALTTLQALFSGNIQWLFWLL